MYKFENVIPVLTYHEISEKEVPNSYILSKKEFTSQIKYLRQYGYSAILIQDYIESLKNPSVSIPEKSILITFDDGHLSDYKIAYPLLKQYGFLANFFISTGWTGSKGYMDAGHLVELSSNGMSIQSHSEHHVNLAKLAGGQLYKELYNSKNTLEKILSKKVNYLSFPGGRFDESVLKCAITLGYEGAMCSIPFYLKKRLAFWIVGRHMIKHRARQANFEKCLKLNKLAQLQSKGMHAIKKYSRWALGDDFYYFLWRRYVKK